MGTAMTPKSTQTSILKHAFYDLSHVSPIVFLCLLKECYSNGTHKATVKFQSLQQQVHLVLVNNTHVQPVTFIARCLHILPIFDSYCDGFGHLILSAVRRYLKTIRNDEDIEEARIYASKLFFNFVNGASAHSEAILLKTVQIFDVNIMSIEEIMSDLRAKGNIKSYSAREFVEQYLSRLIESQSYMIAVDMMIHFSIQQVEESLLMKMIECKQFKAAEKWASHLGKHMLCLLVHEYVNQKLLPSAYDVIKKNDLRLEFPELYHQSKESLLKKLAEKGVWHVAESRAKGDRQLLEYLVYLAMEAGYTEKVEELCNRYSIKGFHDFKESDENVQRKRYLNLHELSIEDVYWVDEVNALRDAICYLESCKVVGIDCEWKPTYVKGSPPSKVSIMQISSEEKVYVFDLIKLYADVPAILDECFARVFHSPSILKLGYNFQCDVKQLSHSYGELNCFKRFEMLLDIQNVFKEKNGGLSGLAQKILGTGLNKTRRNSNWEQRPLSHYELEYAALDAAVLLHIFRHVKDHTQPCASDAKIEWKSHIISHMKL